MSQKPLYVVVMESDDHSVTHYKTVVELRGVALDFDAAHEMLKNALDVIATKRVYVYEFTYDARLHCIGCFSKERHVFVGMNYGRDAHAEHWSALLKGMACAYSMTHSPFGIVADRLPGDVAAETIGVESEVVEIREALPFASDDESTDPYPAA